jgi:hypothetical protein
MKPTVPAPAGPAAWKPWVFRADAIDRNATVDLALLAKGFHIVAHRLPSNPAWCNNSGQTRLSRLKAGCSQDWLPHKTGQPATTVSGERERCASQDFPRGGIVLRRQFGSELAI